MVKVSRILFSSRTMTPNIPAKEPEISSKTRIWRSFSGLHNYQTLTQLNIYGITSRNRSGTIKSQQGGVTELWERTEEKWEGISQEKCQRLIESMPRRIQAVIKAKGGYTKY